jgi:hypothetical protein
MFCPSLCKKKRDEKERILAYWIMTYGIVRIIAGIQHDRSSYIIAATTYFSEAICLEYESYIGINNMHKEKVRFVSVVSMGLGILLINTSRFLFII